MFRNGCECAAKLFPTQEEVKQTPYDLEVSGSNPTGCRVFPCLTFPLLIFKSVLNQVPQGRAPFTSDARGYHKSYFWHVGKNYAAT